MKYFTNIQLIPSPEFEETTLLNAIFPKLHLALVQRGKEQVGVSFPKCGRTALGNEIRLHGEKTIIEDVASYPSLDSLKDYIRIAPVSEISANCQHRVVSRVQSKSSIERILRRSVRNRRLTIEEAEIRLKIGKPKTLALPFLQIVSASTRGQHFKLFVQHGPLVDQAVKGKFSAYGLSNTATIPWF
jgi:CRISPR-associated endonuclease Csy4